MAKPRTWKTKRKLPIVSITIDRELLEQIDARAGNRDMNRSQFFRSLARNDLAAANTDSASK